MNKQINEHEEIRTVETLINEAKALGLRVVHKPDPVETNVVSLDDRRVLSVHVSPEAA